MCSLNFASRFVEFKRLNLDPLFTFIKCFRNRYRIKTPLKLKRLLKIWIKEETYSAIPVEIFIPQNTIFADASNKKWGIVFYKEKAQDQIQGCWTSDENLLHINDKETLVILKALKELPILFRQSHILVCSDNRTAVLTINRQGSICSPLRQDIMKQIAILCCKNGISLKAKGFKQHCSGCFISYRHSMNRELTFISRIVRSNVQRPGDLSRSVFEQRYQTDSKVHNIDSSLGNRSIGCVHNALGIIQNFLMSFL